MSRIKIYQTSIDPARNMAIDHIEDYLDTCSSFEIETQLLPVELKTSIIIDYDYYNIDAFHWNYAAFQFLGYWYYYFIVDVKWKGRNSLELILVLDTINTFNRSLSFDTRTKIIREHQDRFYQNKDKTEIFRKIQRFNETEGITLYKSNQSVIFGDGAPFYLIYKSNIDPESAKSVPINCYFASEERLLLQEAQNKEHELILIDDLKYLGENADISIMALRSGEKADVTLFYMTHESHVKSFTINSETILVLKTVKAYGNSLYARPYLLHYKYNPNTYEYEFTSIDEDPCGIGSGGERALVSEIQLNTTDYIGTATNRGEGIERNYYHYLNVNQEPHFTGNVPAVYNSPFKDINRSDLKNIKIIKLPYSPDNMKQGRLLWEYDKNKWEYDPSIGLLKLRNLNSTFEVTNLGEVYLDQFFTRNINITNKTIRDDGYESKMYHSNFFKLEYIYDSFVYTLELEKFKEVNYSYSRIDIQFKVTNTINSNFMFKFDGLSNHNYYTTEVFPDVLIVKRNNEVPIYTSSYINYINNGYNYDRKNADRNKTLSWINTGLQLGSGALSLASSAVTGGFEGVAGAGFITSGISSIASNIANQERAEQDINQKIHSSLNSAASVSGSDDIDLLDAYSENVLWICESEPTQEMKKLWLDMFYYFGYYYPINERPNIKSRYWFNFLQCEAKFTFTSINKIPKVFLDDIYQRFQLGVTYYHDHMINGVLTYDFAQELENGEVWLVKEA